MSKRKVEGKAKKEWINQMSETHTEKEDDEEEKRKQDYLRMKVATWRGAGEILNRGIDDLQARHPGRCLVEDPGRQGGAWWEGSKQSGRHHRGSAPLSFPVIACLASGVVCAERHALRYCDAAYPCHGFSRRGTFGHKPRGVSRRLLCDKTVSELRFGISAKHPPHTDQRDGTKRWCRPGYRGTYLGNFPADTPESTLSSATIPMAGPC